MANMFSDIFPAAQTPSDCSAKSGVDGKHEELAHIKTIHAAASASCLLWQPESTDLSSFG